MKRFGDWLSGSKSEGAESHLPLTRTHVGAGNALPDPKSKHIETEFDRKFKARGNSLVAAAEYTIDLVHKFQKTIESVEGQPGAVDTALQSNTVFYFKDIGDDDDDDDSDSDDDDASDSDGSYDSASDDVYSDWNRPTVEETLHLPGGLRVSSDFPLERAVQNPRKQDRRMLRLYYDTPQWYSAYPFPLLLDTVGLLRTKALLFVLTRREMQEIARDSMFKTWSGQDAPLSLSPSSAWDYELHRRLRVAGVTTRIALVDWSLGDVHTVASASPLLCQVLSPVHSLDGSHSIHEGASFTVNHGMEGSCAARSRHGDTDRTIVIKDPAPESTTTTTTTKAIQSDSRSTKHSDTAAAATVEGGLPSNLAQRVFGSDTKERAWRSVLEKRRRVGTRYNLFGKTPMETDMVLLTWFSGQTLPRLFAEWDVERLSAPSIYYKVQPNSPTPVYRARARDEITPDETVLASRGEPATLRFGSFVEPKSRPAAWLVHPAFAETVGGGADDESVLASDGESWTPKEWMHAVAVSDRFFCDLVQHPKHVVQSTLQSLSRRRIGSEMVQITVPPALRHVLTKYLQYSLTQWFTDSFIERFGGTPINQLRRLTSMGDMDKGVSVADTPAFPWLRPEAQEDEDEPHAVIRARQLVLGQTASTMIKWMVGVFSSDDDSGDGAPTRIEVPKEVFCLVMHVLDCTLLRYLDRFVCDMNDVELLVRPPPNLTWDNVFPKWIGKGAAATVADPPKDTGDAKTASDSEGDAIMSKGKEKASAGGGTATHYPGTGPTDTSLPPGDDYFLISVTIVFRELY